MSFLFLLLLLLFALSSLVLTLVTCFVPIFISDGNTFTDEAGNDANITRGEITLWEMLLWVQGPSGDMVKKRIILRRSYFTCNNGKVRIQVVEGISLLACVLASTTVILSAFRFYANPVLRVPVALYFLLSFCACLSVLLMENDWYKNSWCESETALQSDNGMDWAFGPGWRCMVSSCVTSSVGFFLAILAFR